MTTPSNVELNVEGTGPRVRTLKLTSTTAPDASGNATADTATHQQVVTLADQRGDIPIDLSSDILGELKAIHEALDLIAMRLE